MPKQFILKKPLISIALIVAISCMLGLVITQVHASMQSSVEPSVNNQHLIPNDLNPKLHWEEQKMLVPDTPQQEQVGLTNESSEKLSEDVETIHSVAMKDNKSIPQPIYDFTTGTSN